MMSFFLFSTVCVMQMLFNVSHPIQLASILIMSSITIGLFSCSCSTSWFLFMLVLIFLGGVMVLIIYMSTLTMNEKFMSSPKFSLKLSLVFGLISLISFSTVNSHEKLSSSSTMIFHVYSFNNILMSIYLMIYLLITMLCVVKLVKFEKGPLVKRL